MPGQQFINTIDLVVCNSSKDICQPGLRVNAVNFSRFDQGIGDGRRLAATLGTHEQIIFTAKGYRAHGAFGSIVIEFEKPMI